MSVLSWIIATTLFGALLSVLVAAVLTLNTRASWVQMLISYAIGALLGAAFLNALPEALELSKNPAQMTGTVLFGILLFFILEKLVLWRHCHSAECDAHDRPIAPVTARPATSHGHDNGRSGMMIMLGDTFHSFVDGVLIAAAFMADIQLGIVTSIAIIAHEIPQEAGDFLILLNSGYTRRQALLFNMFSSAATLLGGLATYFMLQDMNYIIPSLLGLASASMIYVAMSDLIPGLHKRPEIDATIQQVALITLGISSIWLAGSLFTHHA
ncbi:MAG TPA: ZIP family metal transporter [Nitrosospira sp.]|nr:ZIP family metal transporter [Nitrosospira sp.]